jgi:hypothetical protein
MNKRRFFSFLKNDPPRRYFVTLQFFILCAMLLYLLYSAFGLFRNEAATLNALSNISSQDVQAHLKDLYKSLTIQVCIIFGAGFLVSSFFGLVFLHHIMGPLVRVRQILDKISKGEHPQGMIHFRKGDFSAELAVSLSRLLDFLNRSRVNMKSGESPKS